MTNVFATVIFSTMLFETYFGCMLYSTYGTRTGAFALTLIYAVVGNLGLLSIIVNRLLDIKAPVNTLPK